MPARQCPLEEKVDARVGCPAGSQIQCNNAELLSHLLANVTLLLDPFLSPPFLSLSPAIYILTKNLHFFFIQLHHPSCNREYLLIA